jgi:phosphoribosylglycinamide formyltransferase 1
MTCRCKNIKKIAIFASGSGSNAANIAEFYKNNDQVVISYILTNNKDAYVLERAKLYQIPACVFSREDFYQTDKILNLLNQEGIDLIVLAGFLWLVPAQLVAAFPGRIINIHPALLPQYGGKGMFGHHVHTAVVENREKKSGITIHFVNEHYDEGSIIFQAECNVAETDTPDDVAAKVHQLEYEHFPSVIDSVLNKPR